jgi:hypothetical protein
MNGTVISGWTDERSYGKHRAIDISDGQYGTEIVAARAGNVTTVDTQENGGGKYVILAHDGGYVTMYMHLQSYNVSEGENVTRGDVIGYEGDSGHSTGPHVHFEILRNSSERYIPGNEGDTVTRGQPIQADYHGISGCGSDPGKNGQWSKSGKNFRTARKIEPGTTQSGNVAPGEKDFYAMNLQNGEQVSATLDSNSGVYLLMYGPSQFLHRYVRGNETSSITYTANESGPHYFVAAGVEDGGGDYSFSAQQTGSASNVPQNDRFDDGDNEHNNHYLSSTHITQSSYENLKIVRGESDYYYIGLQKGEQLDVSIEFDDDKSDLDLEVYDRNRRLIHRSYGKFDTEDISFVSQYEGIHYIKVYGYDNAKSAKYDMEIERSSGPVSENQPFPNVPGSLDVKENAGSWTISWGFDDAGASFEVKEDSLLGMVIEVADGLYGGVF